MAQQAELPQRGVIDLHTLAILHQAAHSKSTINADVVQDLVYTRFLLGQLFGHCLNPQAVRDCCHQRLMADVHRYLADRGYVSRMEAK